MQIKLFATAKKSWNHGNNGGGILHLQTIGSYRATAYISWQNQRLFSGSRAVKVVKSTAIKSSSFFLQTWLVSK